MTFAMSSILLTSACGVEPTTSLPAPADGRSKGSWVACANAPVDVRPRHAINRRYRPVRRSNAWCYFLLVENFAPDRLAIIFPSGVHDLISERKS